MLSGPGERENTLKVPDYPDLAGKVAVVTGGSGGIGAATCRVLAANGVKVEVNGRDETKIAAVVDAIRSAGGEALGVAADCTDLTAVERMRQRVEEELGPARRRDSTSMSTGSATWRRGALTGSSSGGA